MSRQVDMSRGGRGGRRTARAVVLVLAAGLCACGRGEPGASGQSAAGLELSFEEVPAPGAFLIEAPAIRDKPDGAAGLWAAVRGLHRPEQAEAVVIATGKRINVALYRARDSGPAIRLSNEAADALGLGDKAENVRITALRQRPVVDTR